MRYKYETTRHSSGLRIASLNMPYMESVSVGVWTSVGGRHEPSRLNGAAHFIEHLLFKGTGRRSAYEITTAVEGVGGYVNAFTSEDHTCYYAKASAHYFDRLVDVLFDMYLDSVFPPEEVERERGVIREEILMYRDQPCQYVQEVLSELMWPGAPLGRPLTGTLQTVERLQRQQLLDFFNRNYHAGTTVVSVAGAVTHQQVVDAILPRLGNLRRGRKPQETPGKIGASGPQIRWVDDDIEQTQVALGFYGPSRNDDRRFALKLISILLGENMSSRLFQILRERHGYCYSVHSGVTAFSDTGSFSLQIGVDVERLKRSLEITWRELLRLAKRAPSGRELQQAKDYAIGQNRLGLESTTNQMMWMGESLVGYGKVVDPEFVDQKLAAVTAEEIRRLACQLFTPANTSIAVVGPQAKCKRDLRDIFRRST